MLFSVGVLGIVLSTYDLRTRRIPNAWLSIAALWVMLWDMLAHHLITGIIGAVVAVWSEPGRSRSNTTIGPRRVKYLGVIGLAFGPLGALGVLGLASASVVIEGLTRLVSRRGSLHDRRPLGPWIAGASVLVAGTLLWGWSPHV